MGVYRADAENLPFRDNSFDIVYSNGVLHHFKDTDRYIEVAHWVLKPRGKAMIILNSHHSAMYWLITVPRAIITGDIFRWSEDRLGWGLVPEIHGAKLAQE